MYCAGCGGPGSCGRSCPDDECSVGDAGGFLTAPHAIDAAVDATTTESINDAGCPVASPTYCTDCEGAGFCVVGSCPTVTCSSGPDPYPFPAPTGGDAGDAGPFDAIHEQCARTPPRPLTAGSYTEPNSGLTVHWPAGWTLASSPGAAIARLITPITWIPTGSTIPVADDAELSISVLDYSGTSQPAQALQGEGEQSATSGGNGSTLTLAGQPALVWWYLSAVPEPECPAPCGGSPPSPDLLNVDGLIQFTMTDAGGGFGFEVDLDGVARVDAQPQQVFCDMEAMILGVTLTP
jgi:hypothetical protein